MAPRCFCGGRFSTVEALRDHADRYGHRFICSCGKFSKDRDSLRAHWTSLQLDHPPPNLSENPALISLPTSAPSATSSGATDAFASVTAFDAGHTDPTSLEKIVHPCGLCNKKFKSDHALKTHSSDKHAVCSNCQQAFATKLQLEGHQKAANHHYCQEHDLTFRTPDSLRVHKLTQEHVTGFECLICDKSFSTQRSLDDHLANANHPMRDTPAYSTALEKTKVGVEEANLHCEACDRYFRTIGSFRQHKSSVKHNPISDLRCPLSEGCGQTFTSPSAMLLHLENGKCKSGMTRLKLNAVAHQHDIARHVTYQKYASSAIAASDAAAGLGDGVDSLSISASSSQSGIVLTPNASGSDAGSVIDGYSISDTSSTAGVMIPLLITGGSETPSVASEIMTPPAPVSHSRASSVSGGVGFTPTLSEFPEEWTHIRSDRYLAPSTISAGFSSVDTNTRANPDGIWPCGLCSRSFKERKHLLDHLNSPAHAPKMFHCPTTLVGLHISGKGEKKFKTLSGMAQHIEVGACSGGEGMLATIVAIFEQKVKKSTGQSVKLLKDSVVGGWRAG